MTRSELLRGVAGLAGEIGEAVAELLAAAQAVVDEYDNDAAGEITLGEQIDQLRAVLDG